MGSRNTVVPFEIVFNALACVNDCCQTREAFHFIKGLFCYVYGLELTPIMDEKFKLRAVLANNCSHTCAQLSRLECLSLFYIFCKGVGIMGDLSLLKETGNIIKCGKLESIVQL